MLSAVVSRSRASFIGHPRPEIIHSVQSDELKREMRENRENIQLKYLGSKVSSHAYCKIISQLTFELLPHPC